MKKILTPLFAFILLALPISSFGATLVSTKEYGSGKDFVLNDNLYNASGHSLLSGIIKGDAVVVSGSIISDASISGNAELLGGEISLSGIILRNVRALGGKVLFGGETFGEALLLGGEVETSKDSRIAGDALFLGGKVSLSGTVLGDVTLRAGDVFIDGVVGGNLDVISKGNVVLGPNAKISGSFTYKAFGEAMIDPLAKVEGKTTFEDLRLLYDQKEAQNFFRGIFGLFFFIKLLASLLVLIVLTTVFKKQSRKIILWQNDKMGMMLFVGILTLILFPLAIILLFASILGSVLGFLFTLGFLFLLSLSHVFTGAIFGAYFYKLFTKENIPERFSWREAVLATLALHVLSLIPIVGPVLSFIFFLFSFGVLSHYVYHALKEKHLTE